MPLILCLFGISLNNSVWVGIPIPSFNDRCLLAPSAFPQFILQSLFFLELMAHRTSDDSMSSPQLSDYAMEEFHFSIMELQFHSNGLASQVEVIYDILV
jgi:hypothetical protein